MTNRRTSRPRAVVPREGTVSHGGVKTLSDYRRASISNVMDEIEAHTSGPTMALAHGHLFRKQSSIGSTVLPTTRSHTERIGPEVYSPLFQLANLNLPRDRITMNAWNRIFYDTHPIVRNAINLHSSYPISKINITCKNKRVEKYFLEMAERMDLYSVVYGASLEFWKCGEVFPYAELDRENQCWKRITILNPDYVHVKKVAIGDSTIISVRPDAALTRLVNSTSPTDMLLKRKLPKHLINYIKKGQNIPLDNINVSHLKLLSAPYDIRGTSIIVSIYKDLMLYDKLRESKFAQADGMVNPLTLVKVGGPNDYRPTQSDLEAYKTVLEEAQYDKDFKLVTHDGVSIERVGFSGAVLEIASDIELINDNIYTGLMVPKALMQQESVTYASSSIGLEVLRQRYDIFRNMIKKWLEQKIFAPVCEMQGFFEYEDGEQRLVVPSIDFNHMNLYDMTDYVSSISNFVGSKDVSKHTLYRTLGLSYEEERNKIRQEAIDEAIFLKEQEAMQGMRLSELRNLDPEKAIPEPEEPTSPAGMPEGGEGLPGMGGELPGMPGMGAGPDLGGGGPPPPPPGGAPPGGGPGLGEGGPPGGGPEGL